MIITTIHFPTEYVVVKLQLSGNVWLHKYNFLGQLISNEIIECSSYRKGFDKYTELVKLYSNERENI